MWLKSSRNFYTYVYCSRLETVGLELPGGRDKIRSTTRNKAYYIQGSVRKLTYMKSSSFIVRSLTCSFITFGTSSDMQNHCSAMPCTSLISSKAMSKVVGTDNGPAAVFHLLDSSFHQVAASVFGITLDQICDFSYHVAICFAYGTVQVSALVETNIG